MAKASGRSTVTLAPSSAPARPPLRWRRCDGEQLGVVEVRLGDGVGPVHIRLAPTAMVVAGTRRVVPRGVEHGIGDVTPVSVTLPVLVTVMV